MLGFVYYAARDKYECDERVCHERVSFHLLGWFCFGDLNEKNLKGTRAGKGTEYGRQGKNDVMINLKVRRGGVHARIKILNGLSHVLLELPFGTTDAPEFSINVSLVEAYMLIMGPPESDPRSHENDHEIMDYVQTMLSTVMFDQGDDDNKEDDKSLLDRYGYGDHQHAVQRRGYIDRNSRECITMGTSMDTSMDFDLDANAIQNSQPCLAYVREKNDGDRQSQKTWCLHLLLGNTCGSGTRNIEAYRFDESSDGQPFSKPIGKTSLSEKEIKDANVIMAVDSVLARNSMKITQGMITKLNSLIETWYQPLFHRRYLSWKEKQALQYFGISFLISDD